MIAGVLKREQSSYHANLQEAAKEELRRATSIRRKYGYILDMEQMRDRRFIRQREYLKTGRSEYSHVAPENLYTLPAGKYAIFTPHVDGENADFGPPLCRKELQGGQCRQRHQHRDNGGQNQAVTP